MGEDVWSLVSRQLYSPTTTDQEQMREETKEGSRDHSGDGSSPDGSGEAGKEAAEAEVVASAATAFASYALVVGMPSAGKSTLLNAYLNPNNDTVPKPTVALEYMFARRARGSNMPKVLTIVKRGARRVVFLC